MKGEILVLVHKISEISDFVCLPHAKMVMHPLVG